MTMIFVRDKLRDATDEEKDYVLSLARYAIRETIETDGLSLYWSEPGTSARFSTQSPQPLDRMEV